MPFHAHEVFEDAWKSGDEAAERALWKGLAQLAVGLTHAARGNTVGGEKLLRRGAEHVTPFRSKPPHGIDIAGLLTWAAELAADLDAGRLPESASAVAPRLRR